MSVVQGVKAVMTGIERVASFLSKKRKTFGQVNSAVAAATTSSGPNLHKAKQAINRSELSDIEVLPEYLHVKEMIDSSFPMIFVTGGAGTGKSTFIKWLDNEFRGQTLICAPTGIAALTVSGKTIHSLCRFPPSWIVNGDIKPHPKSLAKHAKILIIDEISMVNANVLDSMNKFFQINRGNSKPFGGLSVVMVGDLFQLPPIVTSTTRPLFEANYKSPKFFSANSITESEFVAVELTKAFRQVDQTFVDLLANIREGKYVNESLESLNKSCRVIKDAEVGTISLSPRNDEVERINRDQLTKLSGVVRRYNGQTSGQFNDKQLPVHNEIDLKVGAQVMLAKNIKPYVNGDIAVVTQLHEDRVQVRFAKSNEVVEIPVVAWDQFDYRFNEEEKEIERIVVGSYRQIPLVLAWAITIHRSQGLTLEKVHLDLGKGSFETGQTYVALSRCRSLETLSLARPVRSEDIRIDPQASAFYSQIREE